MDEKFRLDVQTVGAELRSTLEFFARPVQVARDYRLDYLRADLVAGVTIAVILLPQAVAYAMIAELPSRMGLYAGIVAAIVGALWASSHHLQIGPTNTSALLIASVLLNATQADGPDMPTLAGLLAVLVGSFQLAMGLSRLGVLANFVSHSVIVGFSGGAGVLIAAKQLCNLLGLPASGHSLLETLQAIWVYWPALHLPTLALGLIVLVLLVLLRRLAPRWPGALIGMALAAVVVGALGLSRYGVATIGQLPRGLPPLAALPVFDLDMIGRLSTGALTVAAIGLVETTSITRSIAGQSGQRLDSNQEFVGLGLTNIAVGFLSGYPCSGSFTRSALNFEAGAQTSFSSLVTGVCMLVAMLALAPLAAYVPQTALAAVLIVTAYSMLDRKQIVRIWQGAHSDAMIMLATFFATLFLDLEFAVLTGILFSFAVYIIKTSLPKIYPVLPDEGFRHFTRQPAKEPCPQLAILELHGDLYFGAVSRIEKAIDQHLAAQPEQRFVLLRMHSVDQCDFSGIHSLESIVRTRRERGGDVFMVRVQEQVLTLMKATGFYDFLGADHFLSEERAIAHLFYKIIDPAICIYECDVRVFEECQNLPKPSYSDHLPCHTSIPTGAVASVSPHELWNRLHTANPPLVIDVRQPREFEQAHIPQAMLIPLPLLLAAPNQLPPTRPMVLVCQGGRRSTRATFVLQSHGHQNVAVLQGGMLAWEAAGLLEAIDAPMIQEEAK